MAEGAPTSREFERLTSSVDNLTEAIDALKEQIDDDYVRKDVLVPTLDRLVDRLEALSEKVSAHDAWMLWAQRGIIGAVGAAVFTAFLQSRYGVI